MNSVPKHVTNKGRWAQVRSLDGRLWETDFTKCHHHSSEGPFILTIICSLLSCHNPLPSSHSGAFKSLSESLDSWAFLWFDAPSHTEWIWKSMLLIGLCCQFISLMANKPSPNTKAFLLHSLLKEIEIRRATQRNTDFMGLNVRMASSCWLESCRDTQHGREEKQVPRQQSKRLANQEGIPSLGHKSKGQVPVTALCFSNTDF